MDPSMSLSTSPSSDFQWIRCMELGYADGLDSNDDMAPTVCFECGADRGKPIASDTTTKASSCPTDADAEIPLLYCSKCRVAAYCCRECQLTHWKSSPGGGHKFSCSAYKRVGPDMIIASPDEKQSAREDIFRRIRFYACPFAVVKGNEDNKSMDGFLFVQSESTLAEMSLPSPILGNGRPMTKPRSILLHYLTPSEYDQEVCRQDFELAVVRNELMEGICNCKKQEEIVLLMRFRCGHVAVGIAPLVPDYKLSKSLGMQYYSGEHETSTVLLNIDDL